MKLRGRSAPKTENLVKVLKALSDETSYTVRQLSRRTGVTVRNVVRAILRLKHEGLVEAVGSIKSRGRRKLWRRTGFPVPTRIKRLM